MTTINRILPLPPFASQGEMRHLPGEAQVKSQYGRQVGSRASETLGQVGHRQEPGWPDLGAVWREPQRWPGTYIDLWNLGGVTTQQQGARSRAHGWARPRGQCTTQDGCPDDQPVGPGPSVAPTYSWPTSKADPPSWPALVPDSSLSPAEPS